MQELVFLEERCQDDKSLRDYGINNDFIVQVHQHASRDRHDGTRSAMPFQERILDVLTHRIAVMFMIAVVNSTANCMQVTGFVINPPKPGKRFQSGILVPAT